MKRSPLNPPDIAPRPGPLARALGLLALTVALLTAAGTRAEAPQMPRTIGGIAVVQVAAGTNHSCARIDTGLVYCWGSNHFGQLGDGTGMDSLTPVQVAGLTDVVQIAAAGWHSCARRGNGRVLCWGANMFGQLGDGTIHNRIEPVRVHGLSDVKDVAVGFSHGCVVRGSGRVFCWGRNHMGQLGDGTITDRLLPVRVNGAAVTSAVGVSVGTAHSCLLRGGGRITCWGDNALGQLGQGDTDPHSGPVVVTELSSVTAIASGFEHTCALRGNGRVFCWGNNTHGQMGSGSFGGVVSTPQRVDAITQVVALGLGGWHSCAIRVTGRIYCWGQGATGQLGNGTIGNLSLPTQVLAPPMIDVVNVSGGTSHSCAVRETGVAFCWGWNNDGQLGSGDTEDSAVPLNLRG